MKTATGTTLISNGQLIDGTGTPPIPDAALVIRDGKIAYVGPLRDAPPVEMMATRIDAHKGTIMPGLIEAHFHPTYFNVAALEDLDIKYPVEYVTLLAAANAKLALECEAAALSTDKAWRWTLVARRSAKSIIPAAAVWLLVRSIRMKAPVSRLSL